MGEEKGNSGAVRCEAYQQYRPMIVSEADNDQTGEMGRGDQRNDPTDQRVGRAAGDMGDLPFFAQNKVLEVSLIGLVGQT